MTAIGSIVRKMVGQLIAVAVGYIVFESTKNNVLAALFATAVFARLMKITGY